MPDILVCHFVPFTLSSHFGADSGILHGITFETYVEEEIIMIGYLRGEISYISQDLLIVDVGGVGYNVRINEQFASRLPGIGNEIKVFTYTYVKEDAFLLYGFENSDELNLFKQLIGVNGIGPKGALAILSVMSANDLRFAIYTGDSKAIAKAPGIGGKTAERVILDLKDKITIEDTLNNLGSEAKENMGETVYHNDGMVKDAIEALVALGYGRTDAISAVNKVRKEEISNTEDILKKALKYLI